MLSKRSVKYLTIRQMERAKELLSTVSVTVAAVGYANPAKFSAAFRRWVGSTPSLFKQQY